MSSQLPSLHPPRPHLPYSAPPNYDSSPAASTLSPQTPNSAGGPGMAMLGPQMVSRPDLDTRHQYHQQPHQVSPLDNVPQYGREYEQMGRPPPPPLPLQEPFSLNRAVAGSPPAPHPHAHPGGPLQAHKRAYRQRRKDPSCDACRERKVKCDATDTSSCSECSSRNVKCQFTKETNRRMSSIKQVQDLEKQLLLARQQVSQLRSIVKHDNIAVDDDDSANGQGPSKRRKLTNAHSVTTIQRNMEHYGKGLIKPPSMKEQSATPPVPGSQIPDLPPKDVAQRLLHDYHTITHPTLPFVNWMSVQQHFERIYGGGSIADTPADATAVLFGVLAVGALGENVEDGERFYQAARSFIHFWTEDPSLDLIRASLLSAMYLTETNNRTTGFALMGFVVRSAQDVGLHVKTNMRSAAEEERRFNLWWSIFSVERYLSFELGRPTMINDEDCEPPDEKQQDSPASPQEPSEFEFRVKLARAIPHIQKAFKTPVIAHGILQAIDEQLNNCLTVYPQSQPRLGDDLDLPLKTSLIYLQNKRLLLHRHNLSSASPPDSKSNAIERCMNVARETAQLLARMQEAPPGSMPSPNPENAWQSSLKKRSSAFLCLHLWRCTLFLAGAGEFERALVCARASASLGKHRSVNSSCGCYLEFFLEVVSDKFQRGRVSFGDDDELLTYVSGDLQSSLDQAWIWQSGGDRALLTPDGDPRNGIFHGGVARDRDWNNWDKITNTLQRLAEEQMYRQKPAVQQLSPNRDGSAGSFLAPRLETATAISPAQSVSPGGASNRMSIADLI